MTYSFFPNIPAATDDPADDQPLMQTNFSSTSSLLAVDHVSFNTAGGGTHNQVTMAINQSAPSIGSGVGGLYTNSVSGIFGTMSSLFFQNATKNLRLFNLPLTTSGNNYGITTPWGLILNFGNPVVSSSGQTITFAVPFTANHYAALVTVNQSDPTKQATINAVSNTNMQIYTTSTGVTHFYLAIGS